METIKQVLLAYSWLIIVALIVFLARIGYFYQKTSGERSGYLWFSIPALFLSGGIIWYMFHNVNLVQESVANALLSIGGFSLLLLSSRLQHIMTGERR